MILVVWRVQPRLKTDGLAFLLYLGLYSFGRFFLSYLRVNNILFLGLREAQLIALVVFIAVFPVGLVAASPGAGRGARHAAESSAPLGRCPLLRRPRSSYALATIMKTVFNKLPPGRSS